MEIVQSILAESCLESNCIVNSDVDTLKIISKYEETFNVDSISGVLRNLSTFTKNALRHMPCIIEILTTGLCKLDYSSTETIKMTLIEISKLLCLLPSKYFPLEQSNQHCENDQIFSLNRDINPKLTFKCLKMYLNIIFFETSQPQSKDKISLDILSNPTEFQKYIVKHTAPFVLILTSSRLGNYSWTNDNLKSLCHRVNKIIVWISEHESISSLLSGINDTKKKVLFEYGLLGKVLDELCFHFQRDQFDRNIPWKHALIWCVTKVKFPYLGQHISRIVPALLLLVDDYSVNNKVFGITTLTYLIENVNPSELNLYNHGKVIYDALFNQLYSNKDGVYEITLPCLLKILYVIDDKPEQLSGVLFTDWDTCFEKIIQNIEFSNHLKTRRTLLKHLPPFLDAMKLNIVKHVNNILKAMTFVMQFSDVEQERTRLLAVKVISKTITTSWPVIPRYQQMICKVVIKFLIDIKSAGHCTKELEKEITDHVIQVLILLRASCGNSFDEHLKAAATSSGENTPVGLFVQGILKDVLEMNTAECGFVNTM